MNTGPASGAKVRRLLLIPVLLCAVWFSATFYFLLIVAPCGVMGGCPDDVWQTLGPYLGVAVGLLAGASIGSLFAFVPWAGRRTRWITGGVVAGAWLVLTTATMLQVR